MNNLNWIKIEQWAKWQMPDEYQDAVNTPIIWAFQCIQIDLEDVY